jgi:hypothetical protein
MAAGQLLVQLPLLAVLVTGLALVAGRRRRIGARRATLALAGLGALALTLFLSVLTSVLVPTLVTEFDVRATQIGVFSAISALAMSALTAAGVALLLAAILSAGPDQQPPARYQPPMPDGPGT